MSKQRQLVFEGHFKYCFEGAESHRSNFEDLWGVHGVMAVPCKWTS